MLTEFDDYPCHQTVSTIDNVGTSDRRFYDRYMFDFFAKSGEIYVFHGMAVYPNVEVMDGGACLTIDGKSQRNLRVSRLLVDHDRHNVVVGPLKVEVLEPLHKIRIVCDENQQGFSYDVVCETLTRPFERKPSLSRLYGRIWESTCHYSQCHRVTGTVTVDGQTYQVTPDKWWGFRDHSWGMRPAIYAYEAPTGPDRRPRDVFMAHNYIGCWFPMQFDDRYVKVYFRPGVEGGEVIYPWGDPRPSVRLLDFERKNVQMDPTLGRFKQCEMVLTDQNGDKTEIGVRHLSTIYIQGQGYGGIGDYLQGKPMGKLHIEADTFDLSKRFDSPWTPGDHLVELRWGNRTGYGIFEVVDDQLVELPYAKYTAVRASTKPGE